ncbi:archease [Candidatus Omnitrophota bacterium]
MKNYELLDHTADLGIRVWGKDMRELFINAAEAMYDLITDIRTVVPVASSDIIVEANDRDELLKVWLSELLYYFHTKGMVFSRFDISILDDKHITSLAKGEPIDYDRHILKHEIKAVTFHELKIQKEKERLITDIIFDV